MSDNTIGVIIIIIIVLVGIVSGGEVFKGSPGATEPNRVGTNEVVLDPYGRPYPSDGGPQRVGLPGYYQTPEMQLAEAKEKLRLLQIEAAKQEENKNASIYKGKVDLSYISNPSSSILGYAIISSYSFGENINISGWKIRSIVSGNEQIIGGAVKLPGGGGYSSGSSETPIILTPPARVTISQASSPVGFSFRENKCTGFFGQYIVFSPPLEKRCPDPKESAPPLSNEFNNVCLDYIQGLPRCEVPNSNYIPEDLITYSCKNFVLTQINYDKCVAAHKNDVDFYSPDWRVYPKTTRFLWLDRRETLQLIDSAGKIVDTYSY